MAAPSTSLDSFIHLNEAIPHWLAMLDELAAQVVEQQSRFAYVTQYPGIRLARKKHVSTESLRPKDKGVGEGDDAAIVVNEVSVPSGPSRPSTPNEDGEMNLREIRRKRKPISTNSGASGPLRYRTRSMIVVYYDSVIQEGFEQMVRNIAAARNQLRKGRTAASFQARIACLGMDENPFATAEDFATLNPKVMRPMRPRSTQTNPDLLNSGSIRVFEEADNDLEAAQSLCEVAAHQFLRDGDCDEEIQGARTRFNNCLQLAQKGMELWRQKGQEAEAKVKDLPRLANGVREDQKETKIWLRDATGAEAKLDELGQRNVNVNETVNVHAGIPVIYNSTGGIEVDDTSDTSSVHIELSAFRHMKRV